MNVKLTPDPEDSGHYLTTEPLVLDIGDIPGVIHRVTVPAGYSTDGASIPRLMWSLVGSPFDPRFVAAAVVHDWYCDQSRITGQYFTRRIGDAVFLNLLAVAKVPACKRAAMFVGVSFYSFIRFGIPAAFRHVATGRREAP